MNELIIVALLVFIGVQEWQHRKDMKSMIRAVLSKNAQEFATAERIAEDKPSAEPEKEEDMVPLESIEMEELMKAIDNELN